MPITRDPELEAFKTKIDLRAYAVEQGYELDRRESWHGSAVMRNPANDDKIIIKRDSDQHYVYFSIRDEHDNGSIIDFIQKRQRCSLGRVRQLLRPWIVKPANAVFPALPATAKDRFEVEAAFRRMKVALVHPYLENERKIPAAVLSSPRFAGRIMIDDYGNAVFPHFDPAGLCGYEIKNKGFTTFAKGGEKGLWLSHTQKTDSHLIVCEAAIDALSHAALFPAPQARYASFGGQLNARQPEILRAALAQLPASSAVIAATDADSDGERFSTALAQALQYSGRNDLRFDRQAPGLGKDWNDQLRASSFPTAHF